jgi:hypothetical protein
MARSRELFQNENWDDEFDGAKKRKSTKKSLDFKRKEKYRKNYFDDEN